MPCLDVPICGSVLDLRAVDSRLTIYGDVLWDGELGVSRPWGHVHHQVIQRTPSHLYGKWNVLNKIDIKKYIDFVVKGIAISIFLPCTRNWIFTTWNIMYCTCTRLFQYSCIFLLLGSTWYLLVLVTFVWQTWPSFPARQSGHSPPQGTP